MSFKKELEKNIRWWEKMMKSNIERKDWSGASECDWYLRALKWCKNEYDKGVKE